MTLPIPILKKAVPILLVGLFCAVILSLSIRGILGNPRAENLNDPQWKDEGPMELSPERGRFALMYSLVEDKSFFFSVPLARFAAPDVAQSKGKFVSLFAPALSYIIIPGYLLGKAIGISQIGSFATVSFVAVMNVLLIRAIAIKLGAHKIAAGFAAILFLFASPAFAYAVTLYQHHISVFLILLCIWLLVSFKGMKTLPIIWFCCALSIAVDNPNLFMMFPIGLFSLTRIVWIEEKTRQVLIRIRPMGILTFVTMIFPIAFFMFFNYKSYGHPLTLAGTVQTIEVIDESGNTDISDLTKKSLTADSVKPKEKQAVSFFRTRQIPRGLYTHFLSMDRGMIMYTPIMLLGFLGVLFLIRSQPTYTQLITAVIGVNILLYSMWGDPYGGWAFGSRYLIPTYALLSILLSAVLTRFRRNIFALLLLLIAAIYSIGVNTIGALTSSRNPPYVQILTLESISGRPERYTYRRNMQMLDSNSSKAFVFRQIAHDYLTAWQYTGVIITLISLFAIGHSISLFVVSRHEKN
jgi:hypothetical protein